MRILFTFHHGLRDRFQRNHLHLKWVVCWSFLNGCEVGCDYHQLIPGSHDNSSLLGSIFSSFRKSQILSFIPEKLGVHLIFSDNLDTCNILFLYPFFSSKTMWQKIMHNLYRFYVIYLKKHTAFFHQNHSFIHKLRFVHICINKWSANNCEQYIFKLDISNTKSL